jgi:hypothetical protein
MYNGTIFGGYVRDYIIRNYNKKLFEKNKRNKHKFYHKSYDPETKDRLLIPNDIDIYFKTKEQYQLFYGWLSSVYYNTIEPNRELTISGPNGHCYLDRNKNENKDPENPENPKNQSHIIKKDSINIHYHNKLGPIIYDFRIKLDCLYPEQGLSGIFPPFYMQDALCNTLLMSGSDHQIKLSRCTNTFIDTLDSVDIIKALGIIIRDIENKETIIIGQRSDRLVKIVQKAFRIKNCRTIEYKTTDNNCMICLSDRSEIIFDENNYYCNNCFCETLKYDNRITEDYIIESDVSGIPESIRLKNNIMRQHRQLIFDIPKCLTDLERT